MSMMDPAKLDEEILDVLFQRHEKGIHATEQRHSRSDSLLGSLGATSETGSFTVSTPSTVDSRITSTKPRASEDNFIEALFESVSDITKSCEESDQESEHVQGMEECQLFRSICNLQQVCQTERRGIQTTSSEEVLQGLNPVIDFSDPQNFIEPPLLNVQLDNATANNDVNLGKRKHRAQAFPITPVKKRRVSLWTKREKELLLGAYLKMMNQRTLPSLKNVCRLYLIVSKDSRKSRAVEKFLMRKMKLENWDEHRDFVTAKKIEGTLQQYFDSIIKPFMQ